MASPTKTLSPAELKKLEQAFATDPQSDAYRPLAEAYLGMGRFMEAMVVCKKGVKAHPNTPDPRVLLARVYAEQGKDKKALEELQGALQVAPNDKFALRLTGHLQLKGGEAEPGKANLLKAFELDPADSETQSVMQQFKVEAPKKAAPPPPPAPVAPPPTNGASQSSIIVDADELAESPPPPTNGARAQVPQAPAQPARPASQPGRPAVAKPAGTPSGAQPKPRPSAPRRPVVQPEDSYSQENEISGTYSVGTVKRRRNNGAAVTLALAVLVIVGLAAYYAYGQYIAKRNRESNKQLAVALDALKGDSYDAYQKATRAAEAALDIKPDSAAAHAYAAYAYVIRWGEHGGDETIRQRAEEHLSEAKKLKPDKPISHLDAADALYKFYSGKGAEAGKEIDARINELDPTRSRGSLLLLTYAIIEMNQGDLEKARDALEHAQAAASDDPRIYATMGTLSRRRGADGDALKHFNTALKYTRNSHPEALLGTAALILDQDNPAGGYETAARYLKTLLEAEPPPSPRQLAMAHMTRAFLISRVSKDAPLYENKEFQKKLYDSTGVSSEPSKAKQEIQKEEDLAMQDKNNPELYLIRGKRLFYEDNLAGAADEINKAISMAPGRAHYYVELAKVQMKKEGGEKDAEKSLQEALKRVPDSPKLLTLLAQAQYRQKKIDEAMSNYEKAIKDPKARNGEARYALGRIYRDDKKDLAKASESFEKASRDFSGDLAMVAASYNDLAITEEARGDKAKARTAYENALNADATFEKGYCDYVKFMVKVNDPKDKDQIKKLAAEYVKLSPRGECAGDMQRLAQ